MEKAYDQSCARILNFIKRKQFSSNYNGIRGRKRQRKATTQIERRLRRIEELSKEVEGFKSGMSAEEVRKLIIEESKKLKKKKRTSFKSDFDANNNKSDEDEDKYIDNDDEEATVASEEEEKEEEEKPKQKKRKVENIEYNMPRLKALPKNRNNKQNNKPKQLKTKFEEFEDDMFAF